MGPGPGFEPGLGDPQPHNRQFWQKRFILAQNSAYGVENSSSKMLLNMSVNNKQHNGNIAPKSIKL